MFHSILIMKSFISRNRLIITPHTFFPSKFMQVYATTLHRGKFKLIVMACKLICQIKLLQSQTFLLPLLFMSLQALRTMFVIERLRVCPAFHIGLPSTHCQFNTPKHKSNPYKCIPRNSPQTNVYCIKLL